MTNDNHDLSGMLASATAEFLRTGASLMHAHERAEREGAWRDYDTAAAANTAAATQLVDVLSRFPKDAAERAWKAIDAQYQVL